MKFTKYKFGEILNESKILSNKPDANRRIRVKLNVEGVVKRPYQPSVKGATKQFIRTAGQFIYGKQNFHKGAFGIVPEELDGFESSSDIPSFDVDETKVLAEYIFYYLKSGDRYLTLESLAKGIGSKRIQPKVFFEEFIFAPTIENQIKIIAKLKEIESTAIIGRRELNTQFNLISQLRQAFLREAMEGNLVSNQTSDNKTGADLLEEIKAEKKRLIKEKKIRKPKPLPPITKDEIPYEIPENWVWCRLGEIADLITKGSSPKWQGVRYVDSYEKGILFITSKNIDSYKIDLTKATYVTANFNEIEPRSILEKGDLLVSTPSTTSCAAR